MTFFNTIHSTGNQLQLFTKKAESQDKIVETFFKMNPEKRFTTYEVFAQLQRQGLIKQNTPDGSIKRACTNNLYRWDEKKQKYVGCLEICK